MYVYTYNILINILINTLIKTMKRISFNFLNAQLSEKFPEIVFIIRKKLHDLLHFKSAAQ